MSLNPNEILKRLEMMLNVVNSGSNSNRAVAVCLDTLQASMNNDPQQGGVILSREILERLLQEIQNSTNSYRVLEEHYVKNVESIRIAITSPNATMAQAQAQLKQTFAQKPAPAAEPAPAQPVSKPTPTLAMPAAPTMPSTEDLTPAPGPVGIGGGLDKKSLEALIAGSARVPESPTAQLEFPSTSPIARYFYDEEGLYVQRDEFPRVHLDVNLLEVSQWLTELPEGAYGELNSVDDFDTPTAIMVRMDEAGIAVMWNPINNTYRIFFMELNLDATTKEGFRHRWVSHKNLTSSHLKIVLAHLNRRLGFTA